jgi:hypothetical protein
MKASKLKDSYKELINSVSRSSNKDRKKKVLSEYKRRLKLEKQYNKLGYFLAESVANENRLSLYKSYKKKIIPWKKIVYKNSLYADNFHDDVFIHKSEKVTTNYSHD